MAKDYKLIYKALKKTLKDELKVIREREATLNYGHTQLREKIEYQANKDYLDWLLNQLIPELEGKRFFNGSFTEEGFKNWKKKINK